MKSPAHPDTEMVQHELEPGLLVWRCPVSKGFWIPAPAYWVWHSHHAKDHHHEPSPPNQDAENSPHISNADRPAMLCPESHCLLLRYRVGGGLGLYIDRSPSTGGIWLDDGEWQALKQNGIHASLHMIFNSSYQKRIRLEEAEQSLTNYFFKDPATADRERIQHFSNWLLKQPNRRRINAWLQQQIEHDE